MLSHCLRLSDMKDVIRYEMDGDNGMHEHVSGEFVEYESWEAMWDDYCDMKLKYESLVRELGDLYRDA